MKQTIRLNESELHRIIKESVKRVLREEFEPSNFGEDTFDQIDNMRFSPAEKKILEYAFSLEDEGFSDEEYFDLAYFFAKQNGLNN